MTPTSKLVSTAITGSGVKLAWENPIPLPPGTRTVATSSLVNAGITGTGVHLNWEGQYYMTCRLVSPESATTTTWPRHTIPPHGGLTVVPLDRSEDGPLRLIAYASNAESVKQYARKLAESAAASGSQNARVEVTDAARQPIFEITI